ncbi:hypothetical protein V3664_27145 [Streptomyces sp. CS62]
MAPAAEAVSAAESSRVVLPTPGSPSSSSDATGALGASASAMAARSL